MLRTTYLSKLLPTADDGIVALHQLAGVNHAGNMRPMSGLQIPRVPGRVILIPIFIGIPLPPLVLKPKFPTNRRDMAIAICRHALMLNMDWLPMHWEDGEVPRNTVQWLREMEGAARTFGKDMNVAKKLGDYLKDAGFEDVQVDKYKIPLGGWARDKRMNEIGWFQQAACADSVEAYSLALFTRVLGWDIIPLQVFLAAVRSELGNFNNHFYCLAYVVYGRKPL